MPQRLFGSLPTLVLDDPSKVDAYMTEKIGFGVAVMLKALEAGASDAAMCTPHNAASSPGYRIWDGTIASLRDQLVNPMGWRAMQASGGLEVVRRSDLQVQVTASLGDEGVGLADASPNCRHPKGEATTSAMKCNQLTLAGLSGGHPGWEPILTWWAIYRIASVGGSRRLVPELSLPRAGAHGRVSDWAVRLLLPELEFNKPLDPASLPKPADTVDVSVSRRGA